MNNISLSLIEKRISLISKLFELVNQICIHFREEILNFHIQYFRGSLSNYIEFLDYLPFYNYDHILILNKIKEYTKNIELHCDYVVKKMIARMNNCIFLRFLMISIETYIEIINDFEKYLSPSNFHIQIIDCFRKMISDNETDYKNIKIKRETLNEFIENFEISHESLINIFDQSYFEFRFEHDYFVKEMSERTSLITSIIPYIF